MRYFTRLKPIIWSYLFVLVSAFTSPTPGNSQGNDSRGTDFWLMFNGNLSSPTLTLFITSDVNTTGTVEIPGLSFTTNFTVTANNVTPVNIPASASQHVNNVIDNNGVHVTSQQPVTVYGLNYAPFTTDAYLGLPTDVLGKEYIVMSYSGQNRSEFGIVATVNGTTVTITPSVSAGGRAAGVPYNIVMNRGQTYELGFASDLTGSIITSTQPIGVFGANACANIPPGAVFCDHINEMLPPTSTWGRKFGTVPLASRRSGDTWRFLAAENGTVITIDGVAQPAINRGQRLERILTGQSVIESNKPILVAQFANGSGFSGNPGDPFMMIVPPLEQFLPKYTLTTVSGYVAHYINVVAPNAVVGSLTLDGAIVPTAQFTTIGTSGFSGAKLTVTPGVHNLQATLPFGVFQYGFNQDDSYGYPGGQSFGAVATVTTVTLNPKTGSSAVGTNKCFTALVKDQFNNPVAGVRVDFTITGANPGSTGFAFTNASGIATFCYTGVNQGTDNIVASVSSISDAGSFTWTPPLTVYYSKAAGNLHNVLTWGVNPDGSGPNPPDFGAGKTFNLANRAGVYAMTGNWTVGGMLVNPTGSQLQIGAFTLSIANLTGAGTLSGTVASNLMVVGTAGGNQTLNFTPGSNNLGMLIINRTGAGAAATLVMPLNIYGVLNIQNGAFQTGNMLTLKSQANTTARIAPLLGMLSGAATVEQYIPARRAWRLINTPVTSGQTIKQAWQENAANAAANPNPGFGTHITGGSVFGTAANGFDENMLPYFSLSSIKYYNNPSNNWMPVPNTNVTTVGNKPFMLFVRGNRGINLSGQDVPPNVTVLRAMGNLLTGNQVFNVAASGFTAIPNPYQSPINFATLTRNNVQNMFYLWDPKLGGANGVGAYVTVSWNGASYDITPAPVSPESQYIQPWQSFLVKSTGAAGTLTIKESDKVANIPGNVFRISEANTSRPVSQTLRVNLQVENTDHTWAVADEILASFNATYSNKLDGMDIEKMPNINESLTFVRDGKDLSIERRGLLNTTDTLYLKLANTASGTYKLTFKPDNIGSSLPAFLEDAYQRVAIPISLNSNTEMIFGVSDDPASQNPARFRVLFGRSTLMDASMTLSKLQAEVSPNPVVGGRVNVRLLNQPEGLYTFTLINSAGQILTENRLSHPGGTAMQVIQVKNRMAKGIYQLRIVKGQETTTLKIIAD